MKQKTRIIGSCPLGHKDCVADDSGSYIYCKTCIQFYPVDSLGKATYVYSKPDARESLGDFGFE